MKQQFPLEQNTRLSIKLDQFSVDASESEQIVVWRTYDEAAPVKRGTIILAPGFCVRMYHLSAVSQYLAANGFEVYRYDPLNHLGPSTGPLFDYTMSSGLRSITTILRWLAEERSVTSFGMVASSLSARVAYRAARSLPGLSFLETQVGVTDLRGTLSRVFGVDYQPYRFEDLPLQVTIEKRYHIRTATFWSDATEHNWWPIEQTTRELSDVRIPIAAFVARADDWVSESEVAEALELERHPERRLFQLAGSGHNVSRNPRVVQALLSELTRTAIALSQNKSEQQTLDREPTFTDLSEWLIGERRTHERAMTGE